MEPAHLAMLATLGALALCSASWVVIIVLHARDQHRTRSCRLAYAALAASLLALAGLGALSWSMS